MNQIKNILHKYLSPDALIICELNEKAGDFVWLEKMGYYDRRTGKETKAGKEYTDKHAQLMEYYSQKVNDDCFETTNLNNLKKELQNYINSNPKRDIYEGLTETEVFAFRDVYYDKW